MRFEEGNWPQSNVGVIDEPVEEVTPVVAVEEPKTRGKRGRNKDKKLEVVDTASPVETKKKEDRTLEYWLKKRTKLTAKLKTANDHIDRLGELEIEALKKRIKGKIDVL